MRRRRLTVFISVSMAIFLLAALGRAWATDAPARLVAIPPPAEPAPTSSSTPPPELTAAADTGPAEAAPLVQVTKPSPAMTAVLSAYGAGAGQVARLAVAVVDLRSHRLYGAGDIDAEFLSASLVKVFIAARLLVEGRADDPGVRQLMERMIVCSDDDAGSALYGLAGGDDLASWVSAHYGVEGVAPPVMPGWWGLTRVSARAMVDFYARIADDPTVGPWLRGAMASTQPYGCDGFYQHFGLPAAAQSWQVKQGWMCCHFGTSQMHSTGFVNDRYAVALLAEGPTWIYGDHGAQTLTAVAQTLLPDGALPTGK